MASQLDHAFVVKWSQAYDRQGTTRERHLFAKISPAVAKRGYYAMDEFLSVGGWKSPRPMRFLQQNSADDVAKITALALEAHEDISHRVLTLLRGVGVPMASALLTVADPSRFTVIDFRAVRALRKLRRLSVGTGLPPYPAYLQVCRSEARRTRTDLRTLDRALWMFDKHG